MLPDSVHQIYGFLSPAEMELLFNLAATVPAGGIIVEIGSFQGKSTVCLGLGAKPNGTRVYAIDPHEDFQVNAETHYGMENHAALLKNLVEFEVADTVRVIALSSGDVGRATNDVDLLWIDGSHEYDDVMGDLDIWSYYVSPNGRIALHDSSGHFPGVTQALHWFLECEQWEIAQQVDATTVLERINV